jgi:hypothetical protein
MNLPRLWKFAHGDLGGILTQGFFLKRILEKYNNTCHECNLKPN